MPVIEINNEKLMQITAFIKKVPGQACQQVSMAMRAILIL